MLLNNYIQLPAINCLQKSAQKKIVTEADLIKCNIDGLGNKVVQITNRVTGMIDLLSEFDKNSNEYKELEYRILCGQHFQQNELDKFILSSINLVNLEN